MLQPGSRNLRTLHLADYDYMVRLMRPTKIIFVDNDLSKMHHDVVIFGLYSDYLQHSNIGLIDSSLTCNLKVNYLIEKKQNDLVGLYSSHCNDINRNKFLAIN